MSRPPKRPPAPTGDRAPTFDWDPGTVQTLSDRLAETLREAIIRGDLQPGQPLRQVELSRRLRVSFAPLREAMRQLEAEGFVHFTAFQGAVVAPLETSELRDFIDVLAAIEAIAARSAVPHVTPAVLAEAERAFEELQNEPDTARWLGLILRIRLTLYAPSGRRRLLGLVRLVRLNSHRWSRQAYADPEGRQLAIQITRSLIDVFRAGDPDAAVRLIEETYRAAQELLEREAEKVARRAEETEPAARLALSLPAAPRRKPLKRRPASSAAARRAPRRRRD